jgi:tripartite-type tricarboxylate transporter receptor subunit TctC
MLASTHALDRRLAPSIGSEATMAKVTAWAFATATTLTATAAAQEWPTRPVTMVVPFTAGGPVDVAARLIAPRVSESLGQQIVVENMGGAVA